MISFSIRKFRNYTLLYIVYIIDNTLHMSELDA
jgi:hypothetical protein